MNVKFRIGTVLAAGFRTWFKNLLPFVLLTALVYAPLVIWGISVGGGTAPGQMRSFETLAVASFWLVLPLNILASGLLSHGVIMELQGQRASFVTCITRGLARFFPALATTMFTCLCIGGAMFCVAIPLVFVNDVLATIVMGVVMLYLFSMLSVSTPASALERSGIAAALARSHALTRGHKVAIASLVILLALIQFGSLALIIVQAISSSELSRGWFAFGVYATLGIEVIVGSLGAVMATATYYYLRAEKEGTSATELADVFA